MSDQVAHTPTPWDYDKFKASIIKVNKAAGYTGSTAEANAKFIVKAVNCHEELTQALKKAELYLYTFTPAVNKQDYINTLNQIQQAIFTAEGGGGHEII